MTTLSDSVLIIGWLGIGLFSVVIGWSFHFLDLLSNEGKILDFSLIFFLPSTILVSLMFGPFAFIIVASIVFENSMKRARIIKYLKSVNFNTDYIAVFLPVLAVLGLFLL